MNNWLIVANDLVTNGYSRIIFPHTSLIQKVRSGWERFLQEPQAYKDLYSIDDDLGYVDRRGKLKPSGRPYDPKEFFHEKISLMQMLDEEKVDYSKYEDWLSNLTALRKICVNYGIEITTGLDGYLDTENYYHNLFKSSLDLNTLRCIGYSMEPDKELASTHTDKSMFTLPLIETKPGLFIKNKKGDIIPSPYKLGSSLLFVGDKAQHYSKGIFTSVQHGVTNVVKEQRVSIVFFGHFPDY